MGEHTKATCVDVKIREGETIKIGRQLLTALYTPGHTDDHFSYHMQDRVFTGDCLMIRSTGRTDFQNGDAYAAYDSLFNKLLKLPPATLVYPAHDYNGVMNSTIGEEQRYNPRLQVKNAEEYAAIMAKLNLPKPKLIDIAVPANQHCGI
jgi:glyoxylase-like metal-dependent hydrolase (beta-lactamase superfamily II)